MALDSNNLSDPSCVSKAGTFPVGNLARNSDEAFVSPMTKSGGEETTFTSAPYDLREALVLIKYRLSIRGIS